MEKAVALWRWVMTSIAAVFNLAAFACSIAAEFKKVKMNDIKLDGRLCSLPRTPAFQLGIAAITCLSIAQIAGASASLTRGFITNKCRILAIFSWVCFGLAMILLGTGTSMNNWQRYGEGWLDGECYLVRTGVYLGVAALVVANLVLNLSLTQVCSWCCRENIEGIVRRSKVKCSVTRTCC